MRRSTIFSAAAILAACANATAVRAAAPQGTALPKADQPVDLAPWAYAWRADRAVQEKPEAEFVPRRLEQLERIYRRADTEPLIPIHADRMGTLRTAKYVNHTTVREGPMLPPPKGNLHAALLWEQPICWKSIELRWPKDKPRPLPEAVEVRFYPSHDGWLGVVWDRLAGKPQVSADGLTWTYSAEAALADVPKSSPARAYSKEAGANLVTVIVERPTGPNPGKPFGVPEMSVYTSFKWRPLDLEIEWGFGEGAAKRDYDGRIEGFFATVGSVMPLDEAGTTAVGADGWKSPAGGNGGRRGVRVSLAYLGLDSSPWLDSPRKGALGKFAGRVTVSTKAGSFTFMPRDVEDEPVLAPEYGFYVCKVGGKCARDYVKELAGKGAKTILQRTREHPEATAEQAIREIKLALLPEGTTLPKMKPADDPAMRVQVPEEWWNDAWRKMSYQLQRGPYSYWSCSTEAAHAVQAMDLVGHHQQVASKLDDWLKLPGLKVQGDFVDGEGNFHHGQGHDWSSSGGATAAHLLNMARHYLLTGDREWFERNRPRIQKGADWLIRQRRDYMKHVPNRAWLQVAGLQPPASSGESWGRNDYWFYYYIDALSCEALIAFAQAMADFDRESGRKYETEAREYLGDLRRSLERSIALTPVKRVGDGTYRSFTPGACYFRGPFGGYECEDMIAMPQYATLVLGPDDPRLNGMREVMEDAHLFQPKTLSLLEAKRREKGLDPNETWFWGGLARQLGWYFLADAHLLCDDVPGFLRAWTNNYAYYILPDAKGEYWMFEGSPGAAVSAPGGYPNSNSAAWFMRNFRNMLVVEMNDSLSLAKATPRRWLEQGKKISVNRAPTLYGPVAYEIVSDADNGKITATVEMPSRKTPPGGVVLRLRHPKAAPIRSVAVNGRDWKLFDPHKETIDLKGLDGKVVVEASY